MKRRDMLKATSAAVLGLSAFPLRWVAAAEKKRQKVLYFTRSAGYEHSVVHREGSRLSHSERVLTQMGKRAGFEVECTKDGRVFDGDLDRYDAFAFYTCGDLFRPSLHATPPMTPGGKRKLLDAIAAGKGFVGFHSAADTFHSPPQTSEVLKISGVSGRHHSKGPLLDPFIAMLGGEFLAHGAIQEASLILVLPFPGASNLGCSEGISFTDEWYALANFARDLHVVLVQETKYLKGGCYRRPNYPSTWARRHGRGRVFYTSLGHRNAMWTNPFFQAIAMGGLNWALGNAEADVKPNLDQVTPHANQLKS
jgi:uncharacterized protein